MKNGFFKNYLRVYGIVIFFSSGIYLHQMIIKLNLPKGLIYAFVDYGFLMLHFASYFCLLGFSDQIYRKEEKPNKKN